LLNQAVHRRKPEPNTLADFFRCEKRLENPRFCGFVHTDAIIGHEKLDEISVTQRFTRCCCRRTRLDTHMPTFGHRVARIQYEIHQDLLECCAVSLRTSSIRMHFAHEFHTLAKKRLRETLQL